MHSKRGRQQPNRRRFLQQAGAAAALAATQPLAGLAATADNEGVSVAAGPRPLVTYPGKRELILVHSRPPHLETPFGIFNDSLITPNDAFFVRYHLANFPTSIDPLSYRLSVTGEVKQPLSLSLEELQALAEPAEVVAVNQCSGNSRGYFSPRVFGAQLGNGAMGNARWTGVPLRAVLQHAGVSTNALQVAFDGLDTPVMPTTPDFRKALDIEHALSDEPLLAWAMNGEPLPFLNGYPLKLIVPGYFGTYWVKHLASIEVLGEPFGGKDAFYMTKGYRLPDNDCLCVSPGSKAATTKPISTLAVRSFLTSLRAGDTVPAGRDIELQGIAFDGGTGIRRVEVSNDAGASWRDAELGEDLGHFSFRQWRLRVRFDAAGAAQLLVRATNNGGDTQPMTATWNPAGYRRNVVEATVVQVV